jgi:hypothetical protein
MGSRSISDIPPKRRFTKILSYEEYCRRDRWLAHHRLIAVYIRGDVANPLVAFYDIHGRQRKVLLCFPEHHTELNTLNV